MEALEEVAPVANDLTAGLRTKKKPLLVVQRQVVNPIFLRVMKGDSITR